MVAAKDNKNPQVIKALLAAGAYVNIEDENGKTALTYAKEENITKIIEILQNAESKKSEPAPALKRLRSKKKRTDKH